MRAAEVLVIRTPILALLAMFAVPACSAADDAPDRLPVDAGRDTRGARSDVQSDRSDAPSLDDVVDGENPGADASADDVVPPIDARDAAFDVDAAPEGSAPEAAIDGTPLRDADAGATPGDAALDPIVTTCLVSFTVTGVHWVAEAGAPDGQAPSRVVRIVGDAPNLGSWAPTAGALLTESAAGTWSGTATFRDQQSVEFKFVKLEGATPEWENWQPYDSNRSLRVECTGDAGGTFDASDVALTDGTTSDRSDVAGDSPDSSDDGSDATPPDATSDAATADTWVTTGPARGRSYTGAFGVRPLDATK